MVILKHQFLDTRRTAFEIADGFGKEDSSDSFPALQAIREPNLANELQIGLS